MQDIINALFAARDTAHRLHLGTKSFAKHLALGALYEGLLSKADELAETWQGQYGLLDLANPTSPFNSTDPIEFVKELAAWADTSKMIFAEEDSHLRNIWDEVIAIVFRAKYKLENLQ